MWPSSCRMRRLQNRLERWFGQFDVFGAPMLGGSSPLGVAGSSLRRREWIGARPLILGGDHLSNRRQSSSSQARQSPPDGYLPLLAPVSRAWAVTRFQSWQNIVLERLWLNTGMTQPPDTLTDRLLANFVTILIGEK